MKKIILVSSLLAFSLLTKAQFSSSCIKDTTVCAGNLCIDLIQTIPNVRDSRLSSDYDVNPLSATSACGFQPPTDVTLPGATTNVTTDDVYSPVIPIGFTFYFYGRAYTSLIVNGNGMISFNVSRANSLSHYGILNGGGFLSASTGTPQNLPSTLYDSAIIMGPYHDLDITKKIPNSPTCQIKTETVGTRPHRKFIISYFKLPLFSCNTLIENTHQIVLYEGVNIVEVFVNSIQRCSTWNAPTAAAPNNLQGRAMIGIQDLSRTKATMAPGRKASDVWGAPNMNESWRFVPKGGTPLLDSIRLYDTSGNLISLGDTLDLGNGTYKITFPHVCTPASSISQGDTMIYIMKSFYKNFFGATGTDIWVDTVRVNKTLAKPTISSIPSIVGNQITVCQTTPVTLSGAGLSNATIQWYSSPSGALIATGNSFTPNTVAAGDSIYFATQKLGCLESDSIPFHVKVNPVPTMPSINALALCGRGIATISAGTLGTGQILQLYSAATAGTLLFKDSTSYHPTLTATTTYYAVIMDTLGGCSTPLPRKVVTVTINTVPNAPTVITPTPRCLPGTFTLTPSNVPAGQKINWYTQATGSTPLNLPGTNSYTTPVISSTTVYFAEARDTITNCVSKTRTPDTAKITTTIPAAPTTTPISFCQNSTATALTASGLSGATYLWYTAATGGTGTATLIPSNTSVGVTSYYVTQSLSCGESNRAQIDVTINPTPIIPSLTASTCSGSAFSVTPADAPPTTFVPSGTTYTWTVAANANVTGYSNQTVGLSSISQTLTNNSNTTQQVVYTVTPTSGTTGNCVGGTFTITVSVTPKPFIQNQSTSTCSGSAFITSPTDASPATIVPSGTTYTWTVLNNPNITGTSNQSTPQSNISQILTNSSSTTQQVIYNITPTSGACVGAAFNDTVSIISSVPAPLVRTPLVYCAGATVPISLPDSVNHITGSSLSWYTSATGGTASATPNPTPSTANAGTTSYFVTQTLACGESPRAQIDVIVNQTPVIPNQNNQTICSGTPFSVTPVNAASPLTIIPSGTTYTWIVGANPNITGATNQSIPQTSISQTLANNSNTSQQVTYTVTATSGTSGNCTGATFTITVNVNPKPLIQNQSSAICSGNTFTVNPTDASPSTIVPAGTTYTWTVASNTNVSGQSAESIGRNNISQTLTNNSNTVQQVTYTVIPNTSGNCPGNPFNVTVDVNPKPVIPNRNLSIWTGSGFTITPNNNNTDTLVPSGTTYTWTVSNNTNIAGQSNQTIAQSSISQLSLTNSTNIPQTLTYTIIPTSGIAGTCIGSSFDIIVTVNPIPLIPNQIATICSGAAYHFNPVNFPPTTIVPAGTKYIWTVAPNTDVNGENSEIIPQDSIMQILSNNTGIDQILSYTVTPTTATGSISAGSSFNINITVSAPPTVAVPNNSTVCNGDNVLATNFLSTPAGGTFTWTNSNANIGIPGSGTGNISAFTAINNSTATLTPTITVIPTANGCIGLPSSYTITINPSPKANVPSSFAICNGDNTLQTNFTSTPAGGTFTWTNSNTNIGLAANGSADINTFAATNSSNTSISSTITVTPTLNTCTGNPSNYTITVHPTPTVVTPSNVSICSGAYSTIKTFNSDPVGGTFTWTNSDPSNGLAATGINNVPSFLTSYNAASPTSTITVIPTVNNCIGLPNTYTITINPRLSLGNDKYIDSCYGTAVNLDAQYNTSTLTPYWTLHNNPVLNPTHVSSSGAYQLIAINPINNCSDTAIVNVRILPKVNTNAGRDTIAVKGELFTLMGSGGVNFQWSPTAPITGLTNTPNPTVILNSDQLFFLQTKDIGGCAGYDTVFVKIYEGPTYYIPNSFSPNGDGLNEIFRVIPVGIVATDYFRVYNRLGQLIFETNQFLKGWDGRFQGRAQATGTYVWTVKGTDKNGKIIEKTGTVILIR